MVLLPNLPTAGVPSVHLLDVISQRAWVLGVDKGLVLIEHLSELLPVDLNRYVHVFHDGVVIPVQLGKGIHAVSGRTAGRNRHHAHVALPVLIDELPERIHDAAVRGYPVVGQVLDSAEYEDSVGIRFKFFFDSVEIIRGDASVGVHQGHISISILELEMFGCHSDSTSFSDVLLVP